MKSATPSMFAIGPYGLTAPAPTTARAAKIAGKARAAKNRNPILTVAREIAERLARERGAITADDVQAELVKLGYSPYALGNAAGVLFQNGKFEKTGETRISQRVHAHQNELKVWRLKTL